MFKNSNLTLYYHYIIPIKITLKMLLSHVVDIFIIIISFIICIHLAHITGKVLKTEHCQKVKINRKALCTIIVLFLLKFTINIMPRPLYDQILILSFLFGRLLIFLKPSIKDHIENVILSQTKYLTDLNILDIFKELFLNKFTRINI